MHRLLHNRVIKLKTHLVTVLPGRLLAFILLLSSFFTPAAWANDCWTGGGDGTSWNCGANWLSGSVPSGGGGEIAFFKGCGGPATIVGCATCIRALRFETTVDYVFQSGLIDATKGCPAASWIRCNSTVTFNSGGRYLSDSSFRIGDLAGDSGTLIIDGATSYIEVTNVEVGRCGSGVFIMRNGASATITNLDVGVNGCSAGTIIISCSTLCMSSEVRIGKKGTGYATITNSTIMTGVDFEVGSNSGGAAGAGTLFSSGNTYIIGEDMLIGHDINGVGVATFCNDIITVCGGFAMSLEEDVSACQSSLVTFQNGTTIIIDGDSGQRSEIGTTSNDPASLHIDSGAVFTYCDQRNCGILVTGTQSIIEIDGGTMNSNTPACVGLRLTGICAFCVATGAILRGDCGLYDMRLEFDGGFFGTDDDELSCLLFGANSNITVIGTNVIDLQGGTMLMGADNIIDGTVPGDATTAPDMKLDGGTFATGLSTGYSQTIGNLTLDSNSAIALGDANVHSLTFDDSSAMAWAGTLTIKDWKGTAGVSGTAGRIFFGSTTGLTAAQLAKIQFEGYALGAATLLSTGELVPTGAYTASFDIGHVCVLLIPAPEPSTWLWGGGLTALVLWHFWRRRLRRLKLTRVIGTGLLHFR